MMFRKQNEKVSFTSPVECDSSYTVAMRNGGQTSKPIMEALINGLAPLPADARQSITLDRGTEFSAESGWKTGLAQRRSSVTRKHPT